MNYLNYSKGEQTRQKICDYIVEYMTTKGYSPSVREICKAIGLKSTSSAYIHLSKLQKNGLITMELDKPRTISLVGYKLVKVDD